MGKEGFDLKSLAYELNTKIANGFSFNLMTELKTTNSTSYSRSGGGIISMGLIRISKVTAIEFIAASGVLGGSGVDVQLYDVTNGAEIGLINFLGTDDNLVKSVDVLSYLSDITGNIDTEINVRKAGPIGPSTINTASILFKGLIKK